MVEAAGVEFYGLLLGRNPDTHGFTFNFSNILSILFCSTTSNSLSKLSQYARKVPVFYQTPFKT